MVGEVNGLVDGRTWLMGFICSGYYRMLENRGKLLRLFTQNSQLKILAEYIVGIVEGGRLIRIFHHRCTMSALPVNPLVPVDTLERISGTSSEKIVEAHGSFATSHCISCRTELSEDGMRKAIEVNGGKPIKCRECGGLVKVSRPVSSSCSIQRWF
jgi:hypothetical protein